MIGWSRKIVPGAVAVSLAIVPVHLAAQDEDAMPTIVVTGNIIDQEEAELVVRQTAKALARSVPNDTALPRLIDPLCLAIAGLDAQQGGKLHRLVSTQFNALGVSDAAEGCSPNVLVLVSSTPRQAVAQLAKRQPGLFRAETRRQRDSQLERGDPAVVWVSHERRSSVGGRLRRSSVLPGMGMTGFDGEISADTAVNSNTKPRRVDLTSSLAIRNAVVVLDANAAQGKTLGQLAGYVTMRVLAFPGASPPAGERNLAGPSSILNLFDEHATALPDGLTPFDNALLTGLYDIPINASPRRLEASVVAAYRDGGDTDLSGPVAAEEGAEP